MASLLYRLGKLAARRHWWFIIVWALVLAGIFASTALFMGKLTNQFTIPGTQTQITLDTMKKELPDLAGGNGSVVFKTDGEKFTSQQKETIEDSLKELKDKKIVTNAVDPFSMQKKVDEAQDKVDEGKKEIAENQKKLDDGKKRLADGKKELADGKKQLAEGKKKLADAKKELAANEKKLASGEAQLNAAKKKLAAGQAQYQQGLRQYQQGQAQLSAAQRQLNAGQQKYNAGRAQVAQGKKKLPAAQRQLQAQEQQLRQLEGGLARIQQACAAYPAGQARTACQNQAAQQAGLGNSYAAAQQKATSGRSQLNAGKRQLAAQQQQLRSAEAQLPAAKKKLDSGRAQIAQNQAKLRQAGAQLNASKAQLDRGQAQINANQRKLDSGKAQLAQGKKQIAENQKKLDAAEKKLEQGEKELPEQEKKLKDGEKKLADAREAIALGQRNADATKGLRFVSKNGTTAISNLQFKQPTEALSEQTREELQQILNRAQDQGVQVLYSKEILSNLNEFFGPAEAIGLGIAAVVLFVMMGTLVAAGLPLLMAVIGVGAGVGGTLAFSSLVEMASITPALALMLGLAVGIDYSLFILHRHRRQMLEGMEPVESIGRAVGTAGNAVVFAGLTVVIALAALVVPGLPFLSILGLSAAATVAIAVLVALTLTPALLGLIGRRLVSKRAWRKAEQHENAVAEGTIDEAAEEHEHARKGWGALVTRHPWVFAAVSIVMLAIVAIPVSSMRTALPDGAQEPYGSSAQQAYQEISDNFGGGYNGQVLALVHLPDGLDKDEATNKMLDVADQIREHHGVVAVTPAGTNDQRTYGALQIIPEEGPASQQTEDLVNELQDAVPDIDAKTGTQVGLTGQVAMQIDVSEKLAEALPPYLIIVVGLSLILLLLVFRSIVVPLLATGGFLLSLAAAFGAVVAVYQWGWLGPVFGVHVTGPIMSFLPILLTGILFGLAMDYQVFLVSSMREAYVHGGKAREAVRVGFSHTAPVVTAAALIMASVFAGFIFSKMAMIRPIGFALAVGVLADAFVVRMTLTPALMTLLGRHAWYIPKWLNRILPDVDVEGAKLERQVQDEAGAEDAEAGHGQHAAAR